MAELPKTIPLLSSNAIVSYDWTDIASGLGYVDFYCFSAVDNTTEEYLISDNSGIYSHSKWTIDTNNDTSATLLETYTFTSSPFKTPQDAEGTMYINITNYSQSDQYQGRCYCIVSVYHYDGTTETLLGNACTTATTISGGANEFDNKVNCLNCEVSAIKFKIGDMLRAKVAVYGWSSGGTEDLKKGFGLDPAGRLDTDEYINPDDGGDTSIFRISMPFKQRL